MLKGSIHQENITIINIYELNYGVSKYKANFDIVERRNTLQHSLVEDFNISLLIMDKTNRKSIRK